MIRVAITSDRFPARPFRNFGMEPVHLPCIRVEESAEDLLIPAREAASTAELLLVSSVRTLDLLWPDGSMPKVPVAAVGASTAVSVNARGGKVVAQGFSGLAELVEANDELFKRSRVVFPHAAGSDRNLLRRLSDLAAELEEFSVYRAFPVPPPTAVVDATVFASPSAVEGWLLSRTFDDLVVGVIGPTTGTAVSRHRPPEVIASPPSYPALAQALASYLEVSI